VFVKHGPGLGYYRESVRGPQVYTHLDNGGTLTEVLTVHSMDLTVVDNGDGTLTITSLQTGGYRIHDTRGKLVLLDHGIVFGSTGRNDTQGRDFCDDLREFTQPL
jgi:hypothetical protein